MDNHEGMQRDEVKPAPVPDQGDPKSMTSAESKRQGTAPGANAPQDAADAAITWRDWWVQNAPVLAMVVAMFVFLFGILGVSPVVVGMPSNSK